MIKINNKELKRPIFQGGMGVGVSLSGLAGAVAKAGGAGTISAAQIGFRDPDFDKDPFQANLRAIKSEFQKARAISPNGIIGFNIMVAMRHYEEYVKAAVQAGTDFLVCGAGLPVDLPAIVKKSLEEISFEETSKTISKTTSKDTQEKAPEHTSQYAPALAPVVSTEKSAHVIFRYWEKKHHCVPDFVIIEGPLAGGHLGFTKEQLAVYGPEAYDEEVRRIIALCREYATRFEKEIPVVLAGGISTKMAADHAFSLGVDAIQAATRFVTTYECDASNAFKNAYLNASKEDILLVKSPVGLPGRAVRNAFSDTIMSGGRIAPTRCRGCLKNCKPNEIPYCITDALITSVTGDADNGLVFCGADAWRCERLQSVEEVIEELLPETLAHL